MKGPVAFAAIITPDPETGIGQWTDAQLAKAIRTATDRNGQPYRLPMAFEFHKNIDAPAWAR